MSDEEGGARPKSSGPSVDSSARVRRPRGRAPTLIGRAVNADGTPIALPQSPPSSPEHEATIDEEALGTPAPPAPSSAVPAPRKPLAAATKAFGFGAATRPTAGGRARPAAPSERPLPRVAAPAPPVVALDPRPEERGGPATARVAGPSLAAGFAGPAIDLPGESTQLSDARPTDPDFTYEPTKPVVFVTGAEPQERATTPPQDLVVEPTVVVHPSAIKAHPTYRVDVDSGIVELAPDAGLEPAPRKSSLGLLLAIGALVLFLLLGGGAAAALVLLWPASGADEPPSPSAALETAPEPPPPQPPAPQPAAPPAPAPAAAALAAAPVPAPPVLEAPAADVAGDGAVEAGEEEDDGEEAPAPVGEVVPRAELEGFQVEMPRLSGRARRIPEAERRRQSQRIRTLALRHYRGGEYAEAEAAFRRALELVPREPGAMEGLARATARQRRFPEALAWARLAVSRSPRSATAYRVLGDVWRQAGHPDEAARAYRRGLGIEPANRTLRLRLREVSSG